MSTNKQIVFITGANTGLGLEAVKALYQSDKSYLILLGGRSIEKANKAASSVQDLYPNSNSSIETIQIDIEDDDSIEKAFNTVKDKYGKIDVMLNNAGAQFEHEFAKGNMSMRELWDRSWTVNVTSTQIITHKFIPLLLASSEPRLIFITSGTATLTGHQNESIPRIDTPAPAGWPKTGAGLHNVSAYRSSKTGMNMMMREWARLLSNDGVKVCCISPGFLATGLSGDAEALKKQGAGDPAIGGELMKDVIEGKRDTDMGKVVNRFAGKDGVQPW